MAQATGGTSLVANYALSARTAARTVEVAWDGTNWVDETSRVLSCSVNHQLLNTPLGLPMLGQGIPSEATLAMDNSDSRYCASYTGSIAQINRPDGIYRVPIRIAMGYSGETLRQFTGEIIEAPGTETLARRVVTFKCLDYAYALRQIKHVTTTTTNRRADSFMATLLNAAHVVDTGFDTHTGRALDKALCVIPYVWSDDENLWEQLGLLAASELGMIHFSKSAEFRFWRTTAFLERADSTASQVTLDRGKAFALGDDLSWRNAYTKVAVESNPWLRSPLTNLYEAQSELVIPPGESLTHWARLRYVTTELVTPVSGTDYNAVSSGMMDLSANLTVTLTEYAQQAKLVMENANATQAVYVLNLTIRGYPLIGEQADKDEYDATLTPAKVPGEKVYTVSGNHYIQTMPQQALLGSRLRDLLQRPRRLFGWRGPLCPWLELGDRVTLQDSAHGIDEDALVLNMAINADGARQDMELVLLPVANLYPYSDYFIWGTSAYANSGSDKAYY